MAELLSLPNETLQAICYYLCCHCSVSRYEPNEPTLPALSALSQACSRLREVAQPILFHHLHHRSENPVPLLRNLLARPDLAANIQGAYVGVQWDIGKGLSSEDVDFCDNVMAKFFREDGCPFNVSPSWFTREYVERTRDILFASQPEAALCAIAIALMPNIRVLDLETGYFWRFPFCLPGSLPHLTELNFRHGDTERGQDLIAVEELLAAATNLKSFNCFMLKQISGNFFHPNVVELNLTSSHLKAPCFFALMTGLPNLAVFSYESGGIKVSDGPEAYPLDISHALLIRARTLQVVAFNLRDAEYPGVVEAGHVMTSLKEMRRLKCLTIHSHELYGDDIFDTLNDDSRLIDFLPNSIEHLTLEGLPDFKLHDVLSFGKVSKTQFPRLRILQIPGYTQEQVAELEKVFSQTKIEAPIVHRN
ncbi:hypothetical protein EDB81DRAFT_950373 [Dactylonectria macrodidyma]|uniref:F-box domain-containing protein n=1 Tax=Dactylonectria macrodidyma TaxID=307937 RepID=A0A9P9E6M2_9HYPO|nr:hypothetical protein EDB81DRAFT_950373 [Dactylonectria macrodidyma]